MSITKSKRPFAVAVVLVLCMALCGGVVGLVGSPAGAVAPIDAPSGLSPATGSIEQANPVLSWTAVAGAVRYRVQVSTTSSFSTTVYSVDTYNTSATPPNDLPLGTVYWRVAGTDGGSGVGPYAAGSFTKDQGAAPQPTSPADGAVIQFPATAVTLAWNPSPAAKTYRVEVDDADDFIGASVYTTNNTRFSLSEPQTINQNFFWRVQGISGTTGVNTLWSPTRKYSISWGLRPVLQAPADRASVTDVVLQWTAVPGAASYQVQVSPNGDWANNLTADVAVKGTRFSPAMTFNNASYFWRVRAKDAKAVTGAGVPNLGGWSDEWQFTRSWLTPPTLVSPADGDGNLTDLLFTWKPVPFAGYYQLEIGTDPNFSPTTFRTCGTNHTSFAPYKHLSPSPLLLPAPGTCPDLSTPSPVWPPIGVALFWRVRGVDDTGNVLGIYSAVRSFLYDPGSPVILGPAPNATVSTARFSWLPVAASQKYEVRIWDSAGRLAKTATTYTTSIVPTEGSYWKNPGTYTWSLRSIDQWGRFGSATPARALTLVAATGAPGFTDASVDNPDDNTNMPHFSWNPVEGARTYRVYYAPTASSTYQILDDATNPDPLKRNTLFAAFAPTSVIPAGTYKWFVEALSASGTVIDSTFPQSPAAQQSFTVMDLPVVTPTSPVSCVAGQACAPHSSTPLMQWNRVTHASFYKVYLALDPDFTNVVRMYETKETSLRPREALLDNQAGQSYYWFVQPCWSPSACGQYNASVLPTARAFQKKSAGVVPLLPAQSARVPDQISFSWANYFLGPDDENVGARSYRIEVSTTSDFSAIIDTAEVDQTTYTPLNRTYPEGPLYWRVQARDSTLNLLTFSPERTVFKESLPVSPSSPAPGSTVAGVPTFTWATQTFAAKYEIEIYKDGDTAYTPSNRVVTAITKLTAYTPTISLAAGVYAWRVRRLDVDLQPGPWSTTATGAPARTFTLTGSAPAPLSPANGTGFVDNDLLFTWSGSPGAVAYRLEASEGAGFGSFVESATTTMTSWAPVVRYPDATVYWRVRALDAAGNVLATSVTRNIVHNTVRPTAAITTLRAVNAGVVVTWTATPANGGAITGYRVTPYTANGTVAGTTVSFDASTLTRTVAGLVNGTSYRFRVTPVDGLGLGTASALSGAVIPRATAPFATSTDLVRRQFLDLFGRSATPEELSTWVARIDNGSYTPAQMVFALMRSNEFTATKPSVARLYYAYFVRIPDYGGLTYWMGQAKAGKTLAYISAYFARSSEFIARYGALSNSEFVTRVYQNVLHRTPSQGEVDFWTNQLNTGQRDRGGVMLYFSESSENRRVMANEIDVVLTYVTMLGRSPTITESDNSVARLDGGLSFTTYLNEVMATAEYTDRVT